MRTLRQAVVIAAAVAALGSACGRSSPAPTRAELDCGDFVGHQGARDGITHAGWVCFTDAMASGRAARISLQRPTTEGDPVLTTYTTVGDGTATVVTDARADRFAGLGSRMQREICSRPDPRPEAQTVLVFLDCSTPEPLPSASARPSP